MPETPEQKARREMTFWLSRSISSNRNPSPATPFAMRPIFPCSERCWRELLKRDKLSLDLFWIKDKTLTDTDSLPAPDIMAAEIADDLEAALQQFTKIAARLARKEN